MSSNGPKTLRQSLFVEPYLANPSSVSRKSKTLRERVAQDFRWYQERRKPTSGARVFPTHNELIREPGCVGKMTTLATTCNSRFAVGFPRLTGIFTGKTRKNSSDVKSFPAICCMTYFEYQKTSKTALENRVRKGYARENQGGFGGGAAWRIRSPRGERYDSRRIITRRAASCRARRAARPIKQTLPPHF
uniref:Uncharacterized protein n=1 Tax=Fagus sylvatica TaxID=28930 RepID=A0A2N9ITF3_FAGSY